MIGNGRFPGEVGPVAGDLELGEPSDFEVQHPLPNLSDDDSDPTELIHAGTSARYEQVPEHLVEALELPGSGAFRSRESRESSYLQNIAKTLRTPISQVDLDEAGNFLRRLHFRQTRDEKEDFLDRAFDFKYLRPG